ncbi:MAG: riboflavin synthase, partial [Paracoccaceae bacterium]
MFTGIVTDVGTITSSQQAGDLRLRISCALDIESIDLGASIACEGVCLTVVALGRDAQGWFEVEISGETRARSNIGEGGWPVGRRVNLERALKVGDELGGHIVSGHVDGVAEILKLSDDGDSTCVTLRAPEEFARFIASKGSVALNGTSLTVNTVAGRDFTINLIP